MRFIYISTNGQQRSIEAVDAQTALKTAVDIAPNSGVSLDIGNVSPITSSGIDISLAPDVGAIVPVPVLPPPIPPTPLTSTSQVTVVSFKDNPDGTTTNFYSDGTSETGRLSVGTDGQATFTPGGGNVFTTGIDTLRNEIKVIEDRMIGRTDDRADALEQANVFTDMRALNRLNAELRTAQDRQIEIPLEQRQNLRGGRSRPATATELEQATRPGLEKAVLRELVASRASARLTDTIATNTKIVDTKINAEKERDELIYKQKQDYLKTIEANYANIITEQQKVALEERKFQNELKRDEIKFENDLKGVALKAIIESGGSIPTNALDMSLGELGGAIKKKASTVDVTDMDKDKDFIVLKGLKDLEDAARFYQQQVNQYGVVRKKDPKSAILDAAYQNVLQAYRRAVELGALQGADIGLVESAFRPAVDDSVFGLRRDSRIEEGVKNSLTTGFEIIDRNKNNVTTAISLKQPTWASNAYFQFITGVDPANTNYTDPQALLNAIPTSTTADFFNSI